MAAQLYIIAGFLGAGKTTLMKHLVEEVFKEEKVVIIENDFGDVNVDAAILSEFKIEVSALSAGCICCSLAGNFSIALEKMIKKYSPTIILVEPSGVGKLSDILSICNSKVIGPYLSKVRSITVVDVRTMDKYMRNYGEFYYDQVKNADYIWLSHVEQSRMIREYQNTLKGYGATGGTYTYENSQIPTTFLKEISCVNGQELYQQEVVTTRKQYAKVGLLRQRKSTPHREGFESTTIHSEQLYSFEQIRDKFSAIEREDYGTIIRAKGVFQSKDGYYEVQYLPGDLSIKPATIKGNSLVIIGQNLRKNKLHFLFRGGF